MPNQAGKDHAGDGIDSLTSAFSRPARTRSVPPPIHKPRATPVPVAGPGEAAKTVAPEPAASTEVRSLRPAPETPTKSETVSVGALAPSTVSLDRRTEEVLEAVRTAGRFSQPKVDANRSATIRLAVARLTEQLTPQEIADELRRRAPHSQGTGRKRL